MKTGDIVMIVGNPIGVDLPYCKPFELGYIEHVLMDKMTYVYHIAESGKMIGFYYNQSALRSMGASVLNDKGELPNES